jgi:hypothetical protein
LEAEVAAAMRTGAQAALELGTLVETKGLIDA